MGIGASIYGYQRYYSTSVNSCSVTTSTTDLTTTSNQYSHLPPHINLYFSVFYDLNNQTTPQKIATEFTAHSLDTQASSFAMFCRDNRDKWETYQHFSKFIDLIRNPDFSKLLKKLPTIDNFVLSNYFYRNKMDRGHIFCLSLLFANLKNFKGCTNDQQIVELKKKFVNQLNDHRRQRICPPFFRTYLSDKEIIDPIIAMITEYAFDPLTLSDTPLEIAFDPDYINPKVIVRSTRFTEFTLTEDDLLSGLEIVKDSYEKP